MEVHPVLVEQRAESIFTVNMCSPYTFSD